MKNFRKSLNLLKVLNMFVSAATSHGSATTSCVLGNDFAQPQLLSQLVVCEMEARVNEPIERALRTSVVMYGRTIWLRSPIHHSTVECQFSGYNHYVQPKSKQEKANSRTLVLLP